MKNDPEVGTEALKIFAKEFGPDDIYTRIILEELLKVIMNFEEKEEDGDTNDN